MPRFSRTFGLLLLVSACDCAPAAPVAPVVPVAPTVPPEPAKPPPPPVDVSTPPKPEWDATTLTPAEMKALDRYTAFSNDALALVHVEMSAGAGVPVATFVSTTTNTVERTLALGGESDRKQFAGELVAGGFPKPGGTKPVPPILTAQLQDGKAQVLFSGMPACAPIALAAGEGELKGVSIVAVSATGKKVAVKMDVKGTGEFGSGTYVRAVSLFE